MPEFVSATGFVPEFVGAARFVPEYVGAARFVPEFVSAARLGTEHTSATRVGAISAVGIGCHFGSPSAKLLLSQTLAVAAPSPHQSLTGFRAVAAESALLRPPGGKILRAGRFYLPEEAVGKPQTN
jgi:hypothetical protein